jgi:hypothetical protein
MVPTTAKTGPVNRLKPSESNALDRMRSSLAGEKLFKSSDSVGDVLRDRINALVSLPKTPTIYTSFRELALAFEADWSLLEQSRRDWMQLLQTVVQIGSDAVQRLNDKAAINAKWIEKEWRSELLSGLDWPLSISSVLDARLSPLPLCESQRLLAENISDVVKTMAEHMTVQLDTLVDRCVLGQIEWHGEQACQYSFVDRGLNSPVYGATSTESFELDPTTNVARSTYVQNVAVTKTVSVHVHDLVEAVCSPVSLAVSTIPMQARQVIDSVPKFIQEDLRIVEGNLIRERCIQQDQGTAEWTETWTVLEDLTVPLHFDPAIVLCGRYVLIGWLDDPNERTTQTTLSTSILKSAIDRFFK